MKIYVANAGQRSFHFTTSKLLTSCHVWGLERSYQPSKEGVRSTRKQMWSHNGLESELGVHKELKACIAELQLNCNAITTQCNGIYKESWLL